MIYSKKILILVLLIPILALAALVAYKKHVLASGKEVILPISGYDPRDILAGHYLIYRVDYPVPNVCANVKTNAFGYICLEPPLFSLQPIPGCKTMIRGICQYRRFVAGIEKYYIPEDQAAYLDEKIRGKAASIVISVTPAGHAVVKDLLIDGASWKQR